MNLYLLKRDAAAWGITYNILYTREFRNPQRLGARAKEGLLRFHGSDKERLERFVHGIHFVPNI